MSLVKKFLFVVVALMLFAAPAFAVPVTYGITNGNITIQATQNSDQALIFNQTLSLATSSFITWDSAGVPDAGFGGTLEDFNLSIDPGQGPFATEQDYGPFDMITVETATIAPDFGIGFGTLLTFPNGGTSFLVQAGQVGIDATYSATNSVSGASTPGPVVADITGINNINGTVTFNAGVIQVVFDSVVMGTLDGTPFNEFGNDLTLTANINFFGDANVIPTPEPTSAILIALGLAGLSARRRNV